jgi:L-malate glycosyltransferase
MTEISQFHPSIRAGDAIGDHIAQIRDILREWGYRSDVYCEYFHPDGWQGPKAKKYKEYFKKGTAGDVLLIHYSIGSRVFQRLMAEPIKKVLVYHNITPPKYFRGVCDNTLQLTTKGKDDLPLFAESVEMALGDSEYNRLELAEYGYRKTDVLPIFFNTKRYAVEPDKSLLMRYDDGYKNLLFVSRICPNKKQEDVIKAYYYYKRINPKSRLFLVGSDDGMAVYSNGLKRLARQLGLEHDVYFTGHVSMKELIAYYNLASVFVGMSEHEGFGVPYLESMYFKVPIITYNCCATPYTLKDSGILVNKKDPVIVAELINLVLGDRALRDRLVQKQSERLADFSYDKTKAKLREIVDKVLS